MGEGQIWSAAVLMHEGLGITPGAVWMCVSG